MKLTELEKQSALWQKLKKHAEERIQKLRTDNDKDMDERATQKLRGRIAEAKYWLELDQPPPAVEKTDGFPDG